MPKLRAKVEITTIGINSLFKRTKPTFNATSQEPFKNVLKRFKTQKNDGLDGINSTDKKSQNKGGVILDTLEVTSDYFFSKSHEKQYYSAFQKFSTIAKVKLLTDNAINEDWIKRYRKAFDCQQVLLQDNGTLRGSLCRTRWCQTCNRIKSAEMINGYQKPLEKLGNLYFVTLTAPTVKDRQLRSEVKKRIKSFQKIKDNLRKNYGIKLNGIRKLEITYNQKSGLFHPHFHFIQKGHYEAELLQKLWMKQFRSANKYAQDIRPIDVSEARNLIEIFKYVSKDIVKDTTTAKAQDTIYRSIDGIRAFQTYGKLRKLVPPKEEKTEEITLDWRERDIEIWQYDLSLIDYTNSRNDCLIDTLNIKHKIDIKQQIEKANAPPT